MPPQQSNGLLGIVGKNFDFWTHVYVTDVMEEWKPEPLAQQTSWLRDRSADRCIVAVTSCVKLRRS